LLEENRSAAGFPALKHDARNSRLQESSCIFIAKVSGTQAVIVAELLSSLPKTRMNGNGAMGTMDFG
jgi:hypothetical protein